ncbi:MAG: carboxypeptidase-like regulatory domain-containing protein [Gemmatimonadota bacterium]
MTFPRRTGLLSAILLAALGCSNAGESFEFGGGGNGGVGVFVYLDRDGSLDPGPADTVLAGIRVALLVPGTTDTVFRATTDATGNAAFTSLPLGDYTLVVDTASVGDSVQVQQIDSAKVVLRNNAPVRQMTVRVGFPTATVAQARALPAGRRVFVKGILLANLNVFGDTTTHIEAAGSAIRLTNARNAGPATSPGDSVRVLATTGVRAGQPVLDSARINLFQFGAGSPAPVSLTTLQANTAQGGTHDAALVLLTDAIIQTDTATVNGDYTFSVDDGTGPVKVILDQDVNFPPGPFTPGKTLNGRGLLVPTGTGTWVFKPRTIGDVQLS